MKTEKCTNPNCGADIEISGDSSHVVCSKCDTWHFPTPDQASDDDFYSSDNLDSYAIPDSVDSYAVPDDGDDYVEPDSYKVDDVQAPNIAPTYQAVEEDEDTRPNENFVEEEIEPTIGHLLTQSNERLLLKIGDNTIGRKDTDLTIDDRTVSRKHCVVDVIQGMDGEFQYFIFDIGHTEGKSSTNGVFVSGRSQRLEDYERIEIKDGSIIEIGAVKLILKIA